MTNRDKLRAMSDVELARFLIHAERGDFSIDICDPLYCPGLLRGESCPGDCTNAVVNWLCAEVDD